MEYYKNRDLEYIKYFCEIDQCEKLEQWSFINGIEKIYMVSDLGRFVALNRTFVDKNGIITNRVKKIAKQTLSSTGYLSVSFKDGNKIKARHVHQVVAMAFLGHIPCGYDKVVDHIDDNPLNNKKTNLRVISHRENVSKGHKNASSKFTGVSWNPGVKKWKADIYIKGERIVLGYFDEEIDASNAYQKKIKECGL